MNRALVTGGSGFLGSNLCRRLISDGFEVVALDNMYTGSRRNVEDLLSNRSFKLIEGDVIDFATDESFDQIYNLACPASPIHYQARPLFTTRTSVLGALNMLELAKRCGAKMLHTSTSEIYGDPLIHPRVETYWGNVNTIGVRSCYDEGKRCAETLCADYVREFGTDVRMVRIFNTYGPAMHPQDGRVISNFIMQALRDEDITIFGDGSQTRSFQYCDDLIEAFRRYMEMPQGEVSAFFARKGFSIPVINTGNPVEYTIRELAGEILRQIPESKSRLALKPLPSDDPKRRKPDISLAKELLGWEPKMPLGEGLARTIEYFRSL